jgi:cytochrome c biogenesis protein CcdA
MRSRSFVATLGLLAILGGVSAVAGASASGIEAVLLSPAAESGTSDLTLGYLFGLALGDAVNPCALAVLLVLLTTILTRYPERRDRALWAGLAFVAAVFVSYAALGALLICGLKSTTDAVSSLQFEGLRQLFGAFAIVMGLLNFKDWISHGAGGFVLEVPRSWRPSMQRYLTDPLWRFRSVVLGSFLAGMVVTLFLLPCTAGPYLVAGGLLAPYHWSTWFPLLALYNFVFVLPMITVTLVVYAGFATVEQISDWREENIERLHFVAGVILFTLGVALVAGIV